MIRWIFGSAVLLLFSFYIWVFITKGISHQGSFDMEVMDYAIFLIPGFTYFKRDIHAPAGGRPPA